MKARGAELKVRRDPDFVAVPLSATEIDTLVGLWEYSDSLDHESLSIWLKAVGARELLRVIHDEDAAASGEADQ